jgi:hypothetical protein
MADVQSISVFDVERITISKNERDGHRWVSIDLGGGSSIAVFKSAQSEDWPEVVIQKTAVERAVEYTEGMAKEAHPLNAWLR